jgi:glycosyltransferase involved in cell wall biosynthesis
VKIKSPRISVIIATRNASHCLPKTFESLRSQQSTDFQCIVIDGKSTDGTIELIASNSDLVDDWLSEPDGGIAEAFNKGVNLARGELIYFLGSDDTLNDNAVFADILAEVQSTPRPYFCYGDIYYSYTGKTKLIKKNFSKRKFRRYSCIPHQAMFLDKTFFDRYGLFDTTYKYAMDYEHISRFIDDYQPRYVNRVVAKMHRYGKSSDILATHEEIDRVRLSRKYASSKRLTCERAVLSLKIQFAKIFHLDW